MYFSSHKYILDIITVIGLFETPFFPVFINIFFYE